MSAIIIPSRRARTQQPQAAAEINWGHPLARKLVFADLIATGANAVTKQKSTIVGTKKIVTQAGCARGFGATLGAGASDNVEIAFSESIDDLTIFVRATRNGAGGGNFGRVYEKRVSGAQVDALLCVNDAGQARYRASRQFSGGECVDDFGWSPTGVPTNIVLLKRADPAYVSRLFYDGVEQALVNSAHTSGTLVTNTDNFVIGNRKSDSARAFDGLLSDFMLFAGHLDQGEIEALSENPYQIYAPRRRISYFSIGAGAGSTLNGSATGAAVAAGTATLAAQVALSAVGVSSATGSAAGSVSVPLSATGIAVVGGAAAASATVTISAAALAQAAGSAGLSAQVLLAGAGAAQASGNATLAVQLSALAAGAAQASGSANLSGGAPGMLSANGGAVADGQAVLSVSVNLAAAGNAVASGTANGSANAPGGLSATGAAHADGWASWSVLTTLTAAGFVQAMGAGQLAISVPLSAAGQASASGSAAAALLGQVRHFRLTADCQRLTRAQCSPQRLTTLHHEARHA